MFRKIVAAVFVMCLVSVFSLQSAYADNPNWKADQDARFKKLDIKPGDILTKKDIDKIRKAVPETIAKWYERGDLMDFEVKPYQYDTSHDVPWQKASEANRGKYTIDETGGIIDVATGKYPVFVTGQPFPEDSIKVGDPGSGSKVMYNRLLCKARTETFKYEHIVLWIDFEAGLERTVQCYWATYFYWGRKAPVANPEKLQMRDMTIATAPFDMAGTAQLSLRTLGAKDDQVYAYVPAIRRVKRLSGANRSDPYMGSEAVFDDAFIWNGLIPSMEWTYKGKVTALCWVMPYSLEHTVKMDHNSDGSWSCSPPTEIMGFETPGSTCAKWAPTNTAWVPRDYHVIDAMPKDPYYSCGRMEYWVDAEAYLASYKWVYDKAGEFWKGLMMLPTHLTWSDKYGIQTVVTHSICDDKLGHSTVVKGGCGKVNGSIHTRTIFQLPKIRPRMLTVEKMKMWTK